MAKEGDIKDPCCSDRMAHWVFSGLTSLASLMLFLILRKDLATIEGLGALSMPQTSEIGLLWMKRLLFCGFFLVLPVTRILQNTCVTAAFGMLLFVLVDFRAQLVEFQAIGLLPENYEEQIQITRAGSVLGASALLLLLVLVVEQVWNIKRR